MNKDYPDHWLDALIYSLAQDQESLGEIEDWKNIFLPIPIKPPED